MKSIKGTQTEKTYLPILQVNHGQETVMPISPRRLKKKALNRYPGFLPMRQITKKNT
jgi:hypothetical protein